RHAVERETADPVRALVPRARMPGLVELVGRREARRPRADDRNPLTGAFLRTARLHPALGPASLDDRVLDVLDRDRRVGDAEHACAFARRGARAPGELREVVRPMQAIERFAPAAVVDEIVPLRDQVVDRTAVRRLAERHAAIHAARALDAKMLLARRREDLFEVADALFRVPVRHGLTRVFHETRMLAHWRLSVSCRARRRSWSRRLSRRLPLLRRGAFAPRARACSRSA